MVENVDKLHQAFDTKVKSVVEMCSQVEDQLQGYTLLLKIAEQQTPLQQRRQEEKGKLRSEAEKLVDNDLGAKTTLLQIGICNYVELIDPTFRGAGGVD